MAEARTAAPRRAAGRDRLARRGLGKQAAVRGERLEDAVDVLLDVVEMERDAEVRVARRGDDALGGEGVDECVRIGRDDADQRAVLPWAA